MLTQIIIILFSKIIEWLDIDRLNNTKTNNNDK